MLEKKHLLQFCILAMACLLGECGCVTLFLLPWGLAWAFMMHLLLCGTLFVAMRYDICRNNLNQLLLIMLLGAGPIGAGIILLATCVYAFCKQTAPSPADWIESFFAHAEQKPSKILYERIISGMEKEAAGNGVEPFADILIGGTVLEKQMTIAKMTRYFRPEFAPLLQQAILDKNAAVRVQAATALAKIERDFLSELMQLEKSLKTTDHKNATLRKIASLCDRYAHAGLLDEQSLSELRVRAIEIYEFLLAQGEDADIRFHLARLYLRQNRPQQTRQLLDGAAQSGEIQHNALPWHMEALFRLNDFSQLRQLEKRYRPFLETFENVPSFEPSYA